MRQRNQQSRIQNLQKKAQGVQLESVAHKAYGETSPYPLLYQFLDALDIPQLKIRVKQAKSASSLEAPANAMEHEMSPFTVQYVKVHRLLDL